MKKINFKQPKYIIPLMVFPFLSLFYYVVYRFTPHKQKQIVAVRTDSVSIDPTIQDAGENVANRSLSDKFKSMSEKVSGTDSTAINGLSVSRVSQQAQDENETQEASTRFLDSIKKKMDASNRAFQAKFRATAPGGVAVAGAGGTSSKKSTEGEKFQNMIRQLQARREGAGQEGPKPPQETEMDQFKARMAYVDSLQAARQLAMSGKKPKPHIEPVADTVRPLPVAKNDHINRSVFNTVYANETDNFINAIVDQTTQSFTGTRLRLRLLDDITVSNIIIEKGTYIYGFVTGFTTQRIFITVTGIVKDGRTLPVKISVYDNDGLKGLYVPSSNFRDFTRELGAGSTSAITYQNNSASTDEVSQITQGLISRLFSGTTTAVADLIKKNKARVKYSTDVYLVSEKN